jgi:hypothetical protein
MSATSAAALRAWRRAGGPLRLLVRGRSMAPLLRPGDSVELRPADLALLRPGVVLVVEAGDGLLTHRLQRAADGCLWLWGDALPAPDPPVDVAALLGVVVARVRKGRRLSLEGQAWALLGRALLVTALRRLLRAALALAPW